MTTHEALLAAISDHPADDTARLALADYLDEFDPQQPSQAAGEQRLAVALRGVIADKDNDEPRLEYAAIAERYGERERAEFIRVQCKLAKLPACEFPDDGKRCDQTFRAHSVSCRACNGRKREIEIARPGENSDRLVPGLPSGWVCKFDRDTSTYDGPKAFVGRGFVCRVTCSGEDWITHADQIMANQPVKKVNLTSSVTSNWYYSESHGENRAYIRSGELSYSIPAMQDCLAGKELTEPLNVLAAAWPGIEFTLPPPPMIDAGWAVNPATATPIDDLRAFQEQMRRFSNPIPPPAQTIEIEREIDRLVAEGRLRPSDRESVLRRMISMSQQRRFT